MSRTRIYISLPQDRDAVVIVLARNGYTVRQGKEKKGKAGYTKYVEFWEEGKADGNDRATGTNSADQMDAAAVD